MKLERFFLTASGVSGALAVALGAFGAHGLRQHLAALPDGIERRAWWETAGHYHLVHALALALAGYLAGRSGNAGPAVIAGWLVLFGTVAFSGSLYAMTLTGIRALGAVTPLGGASLIAGWVFIAVAAWRLP
jgi:uncharacterized membrane protein YgdD (TMEM256/DUF423 family)